MSTEKILFKGDDLDDEMATVTEGAKLRRVFGVFDATAHIVGGIIGSGIFISPKVRKEKIFRFKLTVNKCFLWGSGCGLVG